MIMAERKVEEDFKDEDKASLRRQLAQLRMARYTLMAMGGFTLAMFFIPVDRVNALSDISNLFYLSGAGIVGAYMGFNSKRF